MPPKSPLPASLKWRTKVHHQTLAAQISTTLLHRTNWAPLLRPHLPSLTPSLLLQILTRTQSNPSVSLQFFHWARSTLGFQPDLRSLSKMAQILVDSGLTDPAEQLLGPALRSEPAPAVLDSLTRASASSSSCKHSLSRVLSFLLESYSKERLIPSSLETFKRIRVLQCVPVNSSCNALLDALCSSDQIRTAWCVYAGVVRSGVETGRSMWGLLVKILCKEGRIEKAAKLLDVEIFGVSTCEFVMDCYCQRGEFGAAVQILEKMREKNLSPGFSTYALILDGAFRFGDVVVAQIIMKEMIVRELLLTAPFLDYDLVIRRLCELERTYAVEVFFKRVRNKNFGLEKSTYTAMLRAFSKGGRAKEAMRVYGVMLRESVELSRSCCDVFLSAICRGEPSREVDGVLKDVIGRGFVVSVDDLSTYVGGLCDKGRRKEAAELLDLVLEKGILLSSFCCCSLVKHYCANGSIDSAVALHDKMKRSGGSLDVTSYNALLEALLTERRSEEAIQVFDYMREKSVMTSDCFVIMINALCHERELRKAMNLHDEMLKVGLKPDEVTYKHLISGFV